MATPEILLTDNQRTEIIQISPNISEYEIVKYYTFSSYDIKIIKKHRRSYNRFGFALQLALLRNPGCTLSYVSNIPLSVLSYIAEQIQADPKEFELYAKRENTKLEHWITTIEKAVNEVIIASDNEVIEILNKNLTD